MPRGMEQDLVTILFGELFSSDFWLRIGIAATCGSLLGLERQLRARPSGIRTSALICLGSSLFIHLSRVVDQSGADPTRVLGQVVTGVGFLGGGVILSRGGEIKGLTSAAVIWVLAGIGATAGFGRYGLAVAMTFVVLFTLVGVSMLEKAFLKLRQGAHVDEETLTAPRGSAYPPPSEPPTVDPSLGLAVGEVGYPGAASSLLPPHKDETRNT